MYEAPHRWDVSPKEAVRIQRELAPQVIHQDSFAAIETVAGVDVAFPDKGETTQTAVVIMRFPSLEVVETVILRQPTCFPYIPGLLSFREVPGFLAALKQTKIRPDLILVDGQGSAHPRRFGSACHLGLIVDIPTIGVGKSRLLGEHGEVTQARGSWQALTYRGATIGAVLRTRTRVKPLYVSSGHRVGLLSAIDLVMACTTRYRLPEPIRAADKLAGKTPP